MLSASFVKLLFAGGIMRTVSIAEANKKCKNYSGNPSEEREQQDNRHRGASPVGNGQRGKDYAQEIPHDRNKSISACCFHIVLIAHRVILFSYTFHFAPPQSMRSSFIHFSLHFRSMISTDDKSLKVPDEKTAFHLPLSTSSDVFGRSFQGFHDLKSFQGCLRLHLEPECLLLCCFFNSFCTSVRFDCKENSINNRDYN